MARNVIAMYPDLESADRVVHELLDSGVHRDHISVVAHDASQKYRNLSTMSDRRRTENAARGAGGGAIAGAIGGALLAVGLAAIPGVGWIIGAGPVASILATGGIGAAVGAAAGGLGGALSKMGVPEGRANQYAEGVRRGGALVAVEVEDRDADRIANLMDGHHPVDIDRSAKRWRDQEGWTTYDQQAQPLTGTAVDKERAHWQEERRPVAPTPQPTGQRAGQQPQPTGQRPQGKQPHTGEHRSVPVVEEHVDVGKRDVVRGGVRVHTYPVEKSVDKDVELREEHVDVRRERVDRPAGKGDVERAFKDESFEVTEHGEEVEVRKQARVVEEIEVDKSAETHTQHVHETERRTGVDVEKVGAQPRGTSKTPAKAGPTATEQEGFGGSTSFGRGLGGTTAYRAHFDQNYAGQDWNAYQAAYRLGEELARAEGTGMSGQRREWAQIEPEARREWERQGHPSLSFERARGAIRHAFEQERRSGMAGTTS